MYKNSFHEKIKKARVETGFTQTEVSKETGISQSKIAKIEIGNQEPNIEQLGTLADFYNVDVNWLLGTKGGKKE